MRTAKSNQWLEESKNKLKNKNKETGKNTNSYKTMVKIYYLQIRVMQMEHLPSSSNPHSTTFGI
jgi:hypothetical protein